MNLTKYLTVLVVFLIENGDTGGHGEKHHDHVRLHVPEFIHHDHHTKVITIHHHHHKPKEEQHHHHHHFLPKPVIPYGHHYHKHHKKLHTTIKTVSKGKQKQHGHHGHHGHHSHHGHHGHHDPTPHYPPSVNYEPPAYNYNPPQSSYVPPVYNSYSPPSSTFEEDFANFAPAAPSYTGSITPQQPRVHGVSHTVKQVKVFDSLPGALPSVGGKQAGNHGYEVTEAEDDEDSFTSVNSLHENYPATFGFVKGATGTHDPFAEPTPEVAGVAGVTALQSHEVFAAAPQPTLSLNNHEPFAGTVQTAFASSAPDHSFGAPSVQPSAEFPVTFHDEGFSEGAAPTSFVGTTGTAFAAADHETDETPVSFSREAGIQQTFNTGGVQTIEY
ncbi:hypothetical protein evm_004327 [Chilo suppressalis]|nr:hypothetical protein evm_004327 [Chilo suppressalis]